MLRERRVLLQETAREDLRRPPVVLESNDIHRVDTALQPGLQHRGENAAHLMQRGWSHGRRNEVSLCHDPSSLGSSSETARTPPIQSDGSPATLSQSPSFRVDRLYDHPVAADENSFPARRAQQRRQKAACDPSRAEDHAPRRAHLTAPSDTNCEISAANASGAPTAPL